MDTLLEKFAKLGCDNAPGQEGRQKAAALELRGEKLEGTPVQRGKAVRVKYTVPVTFKLQ